MDLKAIFSGVIGVILSVGSHSSAFSEKDLDKIHLPKGFHVTIYSDKVAGARSMTFGNDGTLFVSTRGEGKIYAVSPGKDHAVTVVAEGLDTPNGIAFKDGSLYVAENPRIIRIDDPLSKPSKEKYKTVKDGLPTKRDHGWRYMALGPDGFLYFSIGAPCNICESKDERFGTIMRMKPDGAETEIFARGIRNSVGFDWDPKTKELFFTDNGRDWLGDDLPPDELNHAAAKGRHFGFPYCHGKAISDPEFGKGKDCSSDKYQKPVSEQEAHVANLGMRFYTGKMFPKEYQNQIFIAEHGSWNRSTPIGYRVALVQRKSDGTYAKSVFADGWLQGDTRIGRPVDVAVAPDGALLVSDDSNGVIYRISYGSGK